MRHRLSAALLCFASVLWLAELVLSHGQAGEDKDQVLFNFTGEDAAKDWRPMKLPEAAEQQPAPTIEILRLRNPKLKLGRQARD